MKKQNHYYRITLLLTLTMMGLIFYFSAENGMKSSALSGRFTTRILHILQAVFPGWITEAKWNLLVETIETPIRKMAHFTEYFFLGMFLQSHMHAIYQQVIVSREKMPSYKKFIGTGFAASVLYACTDELHQYFVPGRACRIFDVLVDSSGALCGTLVFCLFLWTLLDGLFGKG